MKKNLIFIIIILILSNVFAKDNNEILQLKEIEKTELQSKINDLINDISYDRLEFNNKILDLRQQYNDLLEKEKYIKNNINTVNNELNYLKQSYNEQSQEFKKLNSVFISALDNLYTFVQLSIITAEDNTYFNNLKKIVLSDNSNRLEEKNLKAFFDIAYLYLIKGKSVNLYEGLVYSQTGKEVRTEILRIGNLNSIYKYNTNEIGFAEYSPVTNTLSMTEYHIKNNSLFNRTAEEIIDLPVDVMQGRHTFTPHKSIISKIKAGGIVIYPIILIGIISLVILIERTIVLNKIHINADELMNKIIGHLKDRQFDKAIEECNNCYGPVSQVILSGLKHKDYNKEFIEDVLQENILCEKPALEKRLSSLSIIAAISPLLGLLGTVVGMINTFNVIAIFGTGNIGYMAGGISEALITTMLGLVVAIPTLFFHSFLSGKVDIIISDMEKNAVILSNYLANKY